LNRAIASGTIEWENSKGELIQCPWNVFNGSGAIVVSRDDDEIGWDLGTRVQIRCEAEKRNCGNMIAAFKATRQDPKDRPSTLTATVRTKGLRVSKCPVITQLAEAQTFLSNASKLAKEIDTRTAQERFEALVEAEKERMDSIGAEQKAVAEQLKGSKKVKETVPAVVEQPVAA
jgi:predicted phage-related endonuclease